MAATASPPKITLYTNHSCPYAHRAHITLEELNLPYDEVLIDLNVPRPQWYLDINPRGLVPSIKYSVPGVFDEEIITESGIVAQFLCDAFPSHLLPATRHDPKAPLTRARINFFVDTWNTKVSSAWFGILMLDSQAEKEAKVEEWVGIIEKEIEPLLKDAKPFFGGSAELTFAEVIAAPFVLRWFALSEDGELMPKLLAEKLGALPNFGPWARAVMGKESVTKGYPAEASMQGMKKKIGEIKTSRSKAS